MKKIVITIATILILALTACGGTSNTPQLNPSQTNGASGDLPIASKLVIGSFNLEETDLAITPEQATELLPLWQVYQGLSSSDTAAQEEIDALIEQIQETMTAEQMQSINDMNLSPQDVRTLMQERGIQFGAGQSTQGNGSQRGSDELPAGGGTVIIQGGPGGGPGGAGGPTGGQGLSPQQIATAQALRAENGGGGTLMLNGTPPPLIEALVEFLQDKAGA